LRRSGTGGRLCRTGFTGLGEIQLQSSRREVSHETNRLELLRTDRSAARASGRLGLTRFGRF
jgi:hypothetical protein